MKACIFFYTFFVFSLLVKVCFAVPGFAVINNLWFLYWKNDRVVSETTFA